MPWSLENIEHPLCGKRWLFGFCRHHIIGWTLWLQSRKHGEFGLLRATQPRRLDLLSNPYLYLTPTSLRWGDQLTLQSQKAAPQPQWIVQAITTASLLVCREKVEKRSILFIGLSPLLSTENVRAISGNQSNLTFIGEYMYSTQVRTLAVGIYDRLRSLVSDL